MRELQHLNNLEGRLVQSMRSLNMHHIWCKA